MSLPLARSPLLMIRHHSRGPSTYPHPRPQCSRTRPQQSSPSSPTTCTCPHPPHSHMHTHTRHLSNMAHTHTLDSYTMSLAPIDMHARHLVLDMHAHAGRLVQGSAHMRSLNAFAGTPHAGPKIHHRHVGVHTLSHLTVQLLIHTAAHTPLPLTHMCMPSTTHTHTHARCLMHTFNAHPLLRSRLSALFRCPNSLFPLSQLFRCQVI